MRQPNTRVIPSYAYKITTVNDGTPIATLQGFTATYNRNLERVKELGNIVDDMLEIVPSRGEFTVSLERIETYNANFATAIGFTTAGSPNGADAIVPSNQIEAFNIIESIADSTNENSRQIVYEDCWIQSYTKSVREGQLLVAEQVTIWPTRVKVITGSLS